MWRLLLVCGVSVVLAAAMIACSKSDVQLTIEATRTAEQTAEAEELATAEAMDADATATATAEAEDAKARSMIEQYCDTIEERFKTDRGLSTITATRMYAAEDWLILNADLESEIASIVAAFRLDLDRVGQGDYYVSWADAFQQSGSKYVGDCKTASWK